MKWKENNRFLTAGVHMASYTGPLEKEILARDFHISIYQGEGKLQPQDTPKLVVLFARYSHL